MRLIEARDLKVGDVFTHTGSKVVVAPSAGLKTPRNKVDFIIETNGVKLSKTWNKNCKVTVN